MTPQPTRVLVVADFNAANVEALLQRLEHPRTAVIGTPLGNVFQTLLSPPPADAAFVWCRPEAAVPAYARLLAGEEVADAELLDEADAYADALLAAQRQVPLVFAASFARPWYQRGLGLLDFKATGGVGRALLLLNHRLTQRLADATGVYLLDAQRWMQAAGPRGDSPSGWYLGKLPYGPDVLRVAVSDVAAALRGAGGQSRKLVVVDLDDTLWGGVVGDAGMDGLRLGGHDAVGEAHVDFQRALKALARRGVVLAIASKNDERVALEAIRQHPEMVLRERDFAAWRISWGDKAAAVAEIAAELNLGLSHVVFIDDNPAERGRVRESHPEVLVPDWPTDPRLYVQALESLACFDVAAITAEDRARSAAYVTERERQEARQQVTSVEAWLGSLDLRVDVTPVDSGTLPRAAQLLNKTNQMNLATRRLAESELGAWAAHPAHTLYAVTVADRFGDAGLTGLVGLRHEADRVVLEDFVLSCRVFGRQIEEAMLHVAVSHARSLGARMLEGTLVPTAKNKPTEEFFVARSGLERPDATQFRWVCATAYPLPAHVTLTWTRDALS